MAVSLSPEFNCIYKLLICRKTTPRSEQNLQIPIEVIGKGIIFENAVSFFRKQHGILERWRQASC